MSCHAIVEITITSPWVNPSPACPLSIEGASKPDPHPTPTAPPSTSVHPFLRTPGRGPRRGQPESLRPSGASPPCDQLQQPDSTTLLYGLSINSLLKRCFAVSQTHRAKGRSWRWGASCGVNQNLANCCFDCTKQLESKLAHGVVGKHRAQKNSTLDSDITKILGTV